MKTERKKAVRRMFYSTVPAERGANRTTCRALKHAACRRGSAAFAVDTTSPPRCSVHSFRFGTQPKAEEEHDERSFNIQRTHRQSTQTSTRNKGRTTSRLRHSARLRNRGQGDDDRESAQPNRTGTRTPKETRNLTNNQKHQQRLGPRNQARGPPEKCGVPCQRTPQFPNTKRNPQT